MSLSALGTWWRTQYSKLPPAGQMIGLQLWLPLFFIIAFCFCYIAAFHSPKFHDAPVAVVNSPAASVVTEQLDQQSPGTFQFNYFATEEEARDAVRDGSDAAALIVPDQADAAPTVVMASAHQYQAAQLVTGSFTKAFAANGVVVTIDDIAPLPPGDSFGQGAMYLMLSWCIGGYMVAMFIGMMGAPLKHVERVGILVGGAIVVALLANLLAGPVIGVFDSSHYWPMVGLSFLWILAIGLFVNGMSYFFGRFITGPALLLFVFLSIPSSGAAFPAWMVPSFFQHLQPYVVGHGITEMIKRVVYGVGDPYWQGFLLMFAYAFIGVVAMFVGKRWREAKEVDRILHGKPTMVAAAQGAMMQHAMASRAATLERHGMDPAGPATVSADDDKPGADGSTRTDDAAYDDIEASMTRDPFLNNGIGDGFSEVEREYEVRHTVDHEHDHAAKHSH
jgi:hypothetical protein